MIPQTPAAACTEHNLPVAADEKDQWTARVQRAQWLRAAILGANDGLLSTTSLMLGVGAAKEDRWLMVLSGLAGAVSGACSMAVGEFVSVSTQRDIEKASISHSSSKNKPCGLVDGIKVDMDIDITVAKPTSIAETKLAMSPALTCEPPKKVSPPAMTPLVFSPGRPPLMKVITEDARKSTFSPGRPPAMEVISEDVSTKTIKMAAAEDNGEDALPDPYKAAVASALAFLCGSAVPLGSAIFVVNNIIRIVVIVVVTSIALALFGALGAHLGGSPVRVSAGRVLVGGLIAMGITYGLLKPFDGDD